MDLGLAGRTVIVTGGASNLGHGIVMAFAREGANVVIADVDLPQAERTAALAQKLGARALAAATDVTSIEQVDAMASTARAAFGRVDVLVNNAGIGPFSAGYFRDYTLEGARQCVDLNFWGTVHCIRAVIEEMVSEKRGSIVNISSGAGLDGVAHLPFYSASKAAVIALSQSLAKELAPHGIRVNAVAPGRIYPSSADQLGESSSKLHPRHNALQNDETAAAAAASQGRLGHPEDVAAMVVFLASDAARFMTGKAIAVDGGARIDMEAKLAATRAAWGLATP